MTGFELKRWRKDRFWAQERAARAIGITRVTWDRYERRAGDVPVYVALALSALEAGLSEPIPPRLSVVSNDAASS